MEKDGVYVKFIGYVAVMFVRCKAVLCLYALHVCAHMARGLTQLDLLTKPSTYSTVVALTSVVPTEPIDAK